jgi:hypothetical protein
MDFKYNLHNAQKLTSLMEDRLQAFAVLVDGPGGPDKGTLAKMLEDGKFPATESKALKNALGKVEEALLDLQMALCVPLEMAADEARCTCCGK